MGLISLVTCLHHRSWQKTSEHSGAGGGPGNDGEPESVYLSVLLILRSLWSSN